MQSWTQDYGSWCVSLFGSSDGDAGGPLLSCTDNHGSYDDSYYLTYDHIEDYTAKNWCTDEDDKQSSEWERWLGAEDYQWVGYGALEDDVDASWPLVWDWNVRVGGLSSGEGGPQHAENGTEEADHPPKARSIPGGIHTNHEPGAAGLPGGPQRAPGVGRHAAAGVGREAGGVGARLGGEAARGLRLPHALEQPVRGEHLLHEVPRVLAQGRGAVVVQREQDVRLAAAAVPLRPGEGGLRVRPLPQRGVAGHEEGRLQRQRLLQQSGGCLHRL